MSPIFNSRIEVENYYNVYEDSAQCYIRKDSATLLVAKNKKQAIKLMKRLGW
jgi:hypothetical protein